MSRVHACIFFVITNTRVIQQKEDVLVFASQPQIRVCARSSSWFSRYCNMQRKSPVCGHRRIGLIFVFEFLGTCTRASKKSKSRLDGTTFASALTNLQHERQPHKHGLNYLRVGKASRPLYVFFLWVYYLINKHYGVLYYSR